MENGNGLSVYIPIWQVGDVTNRHTYYYLIDYEETVFINVALKMFCLTKVRTLHSGLLLILFTILQNVDTYFHNFHILLIDFPTQYCMFIVGSYHMDIPL